MLFRTSKLLLILLVLFFGCDRKTATRATTTPEKQTTAEPAEPAKAITPEDDPEAVQAIAQLTDKIRRDGDGRIIEVDFRGNTIDGTATGWLPKLPRLRSVLLAGTAIADDDLRAVGEISTLENLDLRDCAVSDDGLAHLTSLAKLKALRLSGKSGACSVGDDGMDHVARLSNLKVLAADFLWISEDGLKKLSGLKNLSELYLADATIGNDAIAIMAQFPNLKKLRIAKTQIDGIVAESG